MLNKDARKVINALDMAISAMSNARSAINRSEVITATDKVIDEKIFRLSTEIRNIKHEIQDIHKDMNE